MVMLKIILVIITILILMVIMTTKEEDIKSKFITASIFILYLIYLFLN